MTGLFWAVLLIGARLQAWLVRNSWNTNWGMKGFIAVEYGVDACGISTEPTTVVIKTNHTEF